MQFRSTDNSAIDPVNPWLVSSLLHAVVVSGFFLMLFFSQHRKTIDVDIEIREMPQAAPLPLQLTERKPAPQKPVARHEVFGISPKSAAAEQEAEVKAGNTVAKAPDQEILKPGDAESLPIPSEEYLVSSMPEIRSEVRVPYPPDSKRKGIQGAVVMDLLIDETGKVRDVTLVEGPDRELSRAAMTAARGFQFSPARIQNKSVAVRIRYTYRFVLER